jgi:hypothetical protein
MQDVALPIPTFYQMSSFVPLSIKNIKREAPPFQLWDLSESSHYRRRLLAYFDTLTFERVGVLQGEYALICDCNLLVTRDGMVIKATSAWEDPVSSRRIDELCSTSLFISAIDNILAFWDQLPAVDSPAILSDVFLDNYFHFSLEMAPRIRHVPVAARDKVVIGESALLRPFQTSLLARAGTGCTFIRAPRALRVRNPMVSHDSLCDEGVGWLRQIGPRARRGQRRIYIRRGSPSTRSVTGGGLAETAEILDLLTALNFDIVEFGNGHTVEAQVAMLDGAGLILATHGAALTNIAYLDEGVSVLEVIGASTPRAFFMHIGAMINLSYGVILTESYSEVGDLIIDAATLRDFIRHFE